MVSGYTVFFSYLLTPNSNNSIGNGYSEAIHCNYINKIVIDTTINAKVNINFGDENDFKFLSVNGSGYTASKIFVLLQLIDNSLYENDEDIKPDSANWRMYETTNQIPGYVTGDTFILTPTNITSTIHSVLLEDYDTFASYNLTYLQYPNSLIENADKLCFGDEEFFFGNVNSDIRATAFQTDIDIYLSLNEFNSSTNLTWGDSKVYITEIGIYNSDKNLVGIGKLNNPIPKDGTISRTIVFGLDF